MSHATRHALWTLMCSSDTSESLDEIARLVYDEDTTLDGTDLDALDLATVDLDLDAIDARMVDPVAYFDASAFESLDDMIDALDR